jgi:hypothetical protein
MGTFVWKRGHTIGAVAVLILIGGGIAVGAGIGRAGTEPLTAPATSPPPASAAPTASAPSEPEAKPQPVDPLTGGPVSEREVIAVKVENIDAARPQVGLRRADIVFVEEVEGGQTRLVAVYHTAFPSRLGPVRSARGTDVQLLPLFGRPGLVYSGANSRVQRRIDRASIVPIARSTRDNRRIAPHNVFVNLDQIARSTSVGRSRSIGWTFDRDHPAGARATKIISAVGNDTFTFSYAKSGYLIRWQGRTYADGDTGKLARTDNVVIMKVHNHADGNRDVLGAPSVQSDTVGRGPVTIYRDRTMITGNWRRTKASGPLRFTDDSGKIIALKPGNTWVLLKG